MKIILIVGFVLSLLCLAYCVYNMFETLKFYNEFKVFNENIRNWSESLDDEMRFAINQAAMGLLRDMDNKITELNNNNDNNIEQDEISETRENG